MQQIGDKGDKFITRAPPVWPRVFRVHGGCATRAPTHSRALGRRFYTLRNNNSPALSGRTLL